MTTHRITIANLAGGDARTFRVSGDKIPDAAIRHARRIEESTLGGWTCDDEDAATQIQQYLDDAAEDR